MERAQAQVIIQCCTSVRALEFCTRTCHYKLCRQLERTLNPSCSVCPAIVMGKRSRSRSSSPHRSRKHKTSHSRERRRRSRSRGHEKHKSRSRDRKTERERRQSDGNGSERRRSSSRQNQSRRFCAPVLINAYYGNG